ncbi:glycoside hydrolase family 131 protein [Auriscalpium vulgare]|uniref:Glycoside hydrolase family 131 protein n=1 Tax=Auriscalpium vulgare TaxID=40419 RepID=A0ACB8RL16_9AGAM|nr:glycoside hydrolase family 131 protein [Auriscalpium vulgare]
MRVIAVGTFFAFISLSRATRVLWDGRAPFNYTEADLDASDGPYLSVVKGTQNASHYVSFLGHSVAPTPLWAQPEQTILSTIDNTSIFTPGSSPPQTGFRRGEIIAQPYAGANRTIFDSEIETGISTFHFSIQSVKALPLNYTHEYQVVWIEPTDGTHVFDLQIGTPFNTTPSAASHDLKIRTHNRTVIFSTPFVPEQWHNFAVVVDWTRLTVRTFYSIGAGHLSAVSPTVANTGVTSGADGQGEFHFGILKLPLIDPSQPAAEQGDVVHFGIQEGDKEGLLYSGVFVEGAGTEI